jgi:hypothetical protein
VNRKEKRMSVTVKRQDKGLCGNKTTLDLDCGDGCKNLCCDKSAWNCTLRTFTSICNTGEI